MENSLLPIFRTNSNMNNADRDPLSSGRLSGRTARFYWADQEPSPMQQTFSIKASSSDSHFEESPLVILAISAGVIGVAIIVIILVGIWIRSRLFTTEVERRSSGVNANNASVRSSMSTLDEEEAYAVCMEMEDGRSMHNVADNYCANDVTIEIKPNGEMSSKVNYVVVPEILSTAEKCEQSTCNDTDTKMTLEKTEETSSSSENIRQSPLLENGENDSSINNEKST